MRKGLVLVTGQVYAMTDAQGPGGGAAGGGAGRRGAATGGAARGGADRSASAVGVRVG